MNYINKIIVWANNDLENYNTIINGVYNTTCSFTKDDVFDCQAIFEFEDLDSTIENFKNICNAIKTAVDDNGIENKFTGEYEFVVGKAMIQIADEDELFF